jgi:hypothetical protein
MIEGFLSVKQNRLLDHPEAYHLSQKIYIFLGTTDTGSDVMKPRYRVVHIRSPSGEICTASISDICNAHNTAHCAKLLLERELGQENQMRLTCSLSCDIVYARFGFD